MESLSIDKRNLLIQFGFFGCINIKTKTVEIINTLVITGVFLAGFISDIGITL
jgi:hypothetical protein